MSLPPTGTGLELTSALSLCLNSQGEHCLPGSLGHLGWVVEDVRTWRVAVMSGEPASMCRGRVQTCFARLGELWFVTGPQSSATSFGGLRCSVCGTFLGVWEQDTSGNKGSTWRRRWGEGLLVPECSAGRGPFPTAGAGEGSVVQRPAVPACVSLMGAGS